MPRETYEEFSPDGLEPRNFNTEANMIEEATNMLDFAEQLVNSPLPVVLLFVIAGMGWYLKKREAEYLILQKKYGRLKGITTVYIAEDEQLGAVEAEARLNTLMEK